MTDRTDRELLEAAAKAAGIDAEWHPEDLAYEAAAGEGMWLKGNRSPDNSKYWNPLTDDGDAFRLSITRNLHAMRSSGIRVACYAEKAPFDEDGPYNSTWREVAFCYFGADEQASCARDGFPWAYDQAAATRRAIVLGAAAAIGGAG